MTANIPTLPVEASSGREFRILPADAFRAQDGRPKEVAAWVLSEARGRELVIAAEQRSMDYVIDYEHQTLSGARAPAAGWFKALEWRPDGLYATDARWTDAAKGMIAAREYRFISPVFTYSAQTGEVLALVNIALTNNPALHGLTDLSAVAVNRLALLGAGHATEQFPLDGIGKLAAAFGLQPAQLLETTSHIDKAQSSETDGERSRTTLRQFFKSDLTR